MEILLVAAYTAFFIFLVRKLHFFECGGLSRNALTAIFLLKLGAGIALWAVYTFYYTDRSTADIYKYFDDSAVIFRALHKHPADYFRMILGIGNDTPAFDQYYNEMHYWARKPYSGIYNDSHTIIRFNALVRIFSFGYFNVHTVVMCFLSLTGLTAIYKTFRPLIPGSPLPAVFAIYLLPSVLFWGSGVLKEGIIFLALGLLVYSVSRIREPKFILLALFSAALLAFSKFYVWLALFPAVIFMIWSIYTGHRRPFLKFAIVLVLVTAAGLNIHRFTSIQDPLVTLSQKQLEFRSLASGNELDAQFRPIAKAGSIIDIPTLEPEFSSFLKNAPQALLNVLFRPLPWEGRSALMIMAALENMLILGFIIFCFLHRRPFREIPWHWVLFCLSFVIIQFLIIGETTPVIGAIVRYKVPALPFLMVATLLMSKISFSSKFKV